MGEHSLIPVGSWWLVGMVVMVFVTMLQPVTSQTSNRSNTLIRRYCSQYGVLDDEFFSRNLNTTLSSLRRQLSNVTEYHAVARTIINGESVYGLALCREYLSPSECLNCFDLAVKGVKVCGIVNGGHVIYDDCDLRYENNNFYTEANVRGNVGVCGNNTSSQEAFRETVKELLSDLRVATPRTPDFYAASTRRLKGSNSTVYAIAQCNVNISQNVCAECLSIRSTTLANCLPNTFGRAIDAGCFMRYSSNAFFRDNQTTDLTPFLKDGNSSTKRAIIGGVLGGVGFLLIVLVFILWHRSTKSSDCQQDKSTGATELLQGPMPYSYNDLIIATNNFSKEHKLGEGAFGEVYKGTLRNGEVVAIKKTTMASRGRNTYFDNELKIISNVHHRHLMRLLGYCNKGPHLLLVIEFMENGSLDKFLYGEKRGSLTWKQRFEIIFGIARGLAYLHEQYHVTIVHRDIKSSNILIDNDFQPKLSDFGLVRLLPEDKTHISTKVAGAFGYVAPEYAVHGQVSEKVDAYSFGVVVLEIISGRRCTDGIENGYVTQNLVDYAWNLYENGMHVNLIDITLEPSEYVQEDVKKIIELSLMCTQSPASTRPSMSEVVTLLSDSSPEQRSPLRSTLSEPHLQIPLDTSTFAPSTSNATASTVELSDR
ncbi:cysteine-rich receptor-like protein kinase 2 [Cynara cardunculus var. scolymus]|uniref:cysteine-rich receptor-like protein kinase 2 n=1 Tax=Cynara cardunculus var. scolymus TaxID=59895 RepID=UPI000D62FA9E|nr:cysteine-rich receptor-like protein kinase 2 [Cynara cardunculus var. scolymus]